MDLPLRESTGEEGGDGLTITNNMYTAPIRLRGYVETANTLWKESYYSETINHCVLSNLPSPRWEPEGLNCATKLGWMESWFPRHNAMLKVKILTLQSAQATAHSTTPPVKERRVGSK